jgi:hypothetical protein
MRRPTFKRPSVCKNARECGLLEATIVERFNPDPETRRYLDRNMALILDLDPEYFLAKSEDKKPRYMFDMIYSCGVNILNYFITVFRCGHRSYFWKSGRNSGLTGKALPRLLIEKSDSLS